MFLSRLSWVALASVFLALGHTVAAQSASLNRLDGALLEAADRGDVVSAQNLLSKGANIETRDSRGRTPLILAVEGHHADSVQMLLRAGADVEAKDADGDTALVVAASNADVDGDIIKLLVQRGVSVDQMNKALFELTNGLPAMIVIQAPPEVAAENQHPDPSQTQDSVDWSHADIARLLLDKGAEVEARNEVGATPLIWAAEFGATGMVKVFLKRGAQIEATNGGGDTALIAAACNCAAIDMPDTYDAMELLLAKKANIEARNQNGETALIRAASWGRAENVNLLLDKGADIEARDNDGKTALLVAATASALPGADAVQTLLDRKANIEATDEKGNTPLILAVSGEGYDQVKVVKLLLGHGANVRAKNSDGETALSLATKNGETEAASLIEQALANSR